MSKEERCIEIRGEALANEILLQINLPSELRIRFGTPEEIKKNTEEYERVLLEHNIKQGLLLAELEELESE